LFRLLKSSSLLFLRGFYLTVQLLPKNSKSSQIHRNCSI
jgi:hypothetical protein